MIRYEAKFLKVFILGSVNLLLAWHMRFNEVRRVGVSKAEEKLKRTLEVGTAKISIKESCF